MNEFVPLYASGGDGEALSGEYDVDRMNREFALVLIGKDTVIHWSRPEFHEDRWLSVNSFQNLGLNTSTTVKRGKARPKSMTFVQRWLEDEARRTYRGVEFFPNPDGEPGIPGYLNLWRGFSVEPSTKGSCAVFIDHLKTNVCNEDPELFRWLFGWMAQMVQEPRRKPGTAVVLRGGMGFGKSIVGETLGSLFKPHFVQAESERYVTGQFNFHQAQCLLLLADEAVWAGDKAAEGRIKGLITSSSNMVERKGVDAVEVKNFMRLMMTSNNDWVVPAGKDERRFAIFDVNPRCAQQHDYFREILDELGAGGRARLLHELLHFDVSNINLRTIPQTAALFEQKVHTFDPVESWWFERLQAGEPTRKHGLWPEFCQTEWMIDDYLAAAERVGVGRRATATQFGMKFAKLMPQARKERRTFSEDGEMSTRRVWGYALPELSEARRAFEEACRQPIDWGEGHQYG